MSFASRLTHTVSIIRKNDLATLDDHGQPVTADEVIETVKAAIQRRRLAGLQEQAAVSQAGAALAEHTIVLHPTDLRTADAIFHDEDVCPVLSDLPTDRYEVIGISNAAGLGHHLEVMARRVGAALEAEGS